MSSLCNVEASLPPGFRFHPRDEELICDYLMNWVSGIGHHLPMITKVELYKYEPWEIPETACVGGKEWYFYCSRDKKYATGQRTNRATMSGYWKATGKDRPVCQKGIQVGMRKTLVFYQGRAPKGRKTDWVMHEFQLEEGPGFKPVVSTAKDDCVLCRIFKKRSDISSGKQEAAKSPTLDELPPQSLPPSSSTGIDNRMVSGQYDEQVPCFSIVTPSQSNPYFSRFNTQQVILPDKFMPDFNVYLSSSNEDPSPYNKWEMKSVSNHYAKREISLDQGGIYESGEGSCDSYLSEANLSSL